MNTQDAKVVVDEVEAKLEVEKAPPKAKRGKAERRESGTPTVESQVEAAQEVDQGESAEELLAQAQNYVKLGGYVDYSGSPEATTNLRERIDAFFVLKAKK